MSSKLRDENERLVAEQAVLLYREVVQAMHAAPHGQGLATMEAAVLPGGQALVREILRRAVSTHPEVQKRGSARGRAPAEKSPPSSGRPPKR